MTGHAERDCKCSRPTRDAAYVCDDCGDNLARSLGDVPWITEELEISVTRQKGVDYRRVGGGSGSKKPSERPSPVVWGASEARTNLKAILVAWALFCEEEGVRNSSPYPGLPDDNLPALSAWLLWRVDGLTLHEIGADAVDEIVDAVAHCHRLIDRPADARFYGRCECGEWLYGRPGAERVKCRGCGEHHEVDALNADMWERAMDKLVTVTEARALANRMGFEVPASTMFRWVGKWVKSGRLIARSGDTDQARRFAFREIAALLEATREEAA